MTDEESPASPEEMLRVIEQQNLATVKWLHGDPLLLYFPWGAAWVLGFGALFLHYGLDGHSYVPISQMQAVAVLLGGQIIAGAFATYGIVRMSRLVRGESSAKGMMYGYSWAAGMVLMSIIASRMSPMLPDDESGLLWGGTALLVVAVGQMAGGAIYANWPMFFVGAWVAAVNALGVLLGAGWHALLSAVLLGGGFIAVGLWMRHCE